MLFVFLVYGLPYVGGKAPSVSAFWQMVEEHIYLLFDASAVNMREYGSFVFFRVFAGQSVDGFAPLL